MLPIIEMTRELGPLLWGLNVALVVSAAGVLGAAMAPLLRDWLDNRERPSIVIGRPALQGHAR